VIRLAVLAVLWVTLAAATPLPLKPPPPDVSAFVPWVKAPIDKPPISLPRVPLPPPPSDLPDLPPVALTLPRAVKPMAPVPVPRTLACGFTWLPVASESLECGLSRYARGEYEEAAKSFEQAARSGTGWVLVEARYWLGEALFRLERYDQADSNFRPVMREAHEYAVWAANSSGWCALRMGQIDRARETFDQLLKRPRGIPAPLDAWASHGLALALYALRRYPEAEATWAALAARRPPPALEREILFWHGEALGRIGEYMRASQMLSRFTQPADLHPLQWTALIRLGWRNLQAGFPKEAVQTFKAFQASQPSRDAVLSADERQWADAGLALALLRLKDEAGARKILESLEARKSVVAVPVRMQLAGLSVEAGQAGPALEILQSLLSANLAPTIRAWVLLVKGDAHLLDGNRDEARTHYDLARQIDRTSANGLHAALRLGRVNFELREYGQAAKDVAPILTARVAPEVRQAALVIEGEAAYQASDYATAATAYQTFLLEAPDHALAPSVRLALGWTALRQKRNEDALRLFLDFARADSGDPHVVDALVLASELMLGANDIDQARPTLDRIIVAHGTSPRAEFARLNRAILMVKTGQATAAEKDLRDWIARAPFPPLVGRARGTLGAALLALGRRPDAVKEFERARQEGFSEFGALGLGSVALADGRWDDAGKFLTEARDTGPSWYAPVIEYGLAAVAFQRGAVRDFERVAVAAIDDSPNSAAAPDLLYILIAIDADRGEWPGALAMARRLVTQFADHEVVDDALERIGAAAAKASAWSVALQAYTLLRQRYPASPFVESSRLVYAQALMETGQADEGRKTLEEFVAAHPRDDRAPQAWLALAKAREAAGDRAGAMEAYGRASESRSAPFNRDARLNHARLLRGAQRWEEARRALEPDLKASDTGVVADTAFAIAETFDGQGEHFAAAEYYMTAAYLGPESPVGRRALVAAGRSFTALKQPDSAATVYRKLLAQTDVPADLAQAARRGLADLKR
jgi:tetratricopeptide (TPR) repeat protein